ncbi:MAG: hypothetical protein AAF202_01380, partial [Pseudomonadota bacterium]
YRGRGPAQGMSLENVKLHSSVALATSFITIRPEEAGYISGFLRGVEFNFGIDLLSEDWLAEVSVRSYQPDDINSDTQISMREFDLKVTYESRLSRSIKGRFSGGLAARYLRFISRNQEEVLRDRYTTPASIFSAGLAFSLTKVLSLGADLSYRTALIDDSVDRSSLDAALRIGAEF